MIRARRLSEALDHVELSHIALYVWLLLGKVWVVVDGHIPLPHNLPFWVHEGWLAVGFAAPLMVFAAYWLIYRCPGKPRYVGLWLRLGADMSQFLIMTIFLYGMLTHVYGDQKGHVFGAFFIAALLNFLASMILRDALVLTRTERVAQAVRNGE